MKMQDMRAPGLLGKVQEMGLFHTPENAKEIHDYIESLSGSERQVGWVVYGLFNNLIARELKRWEGLDNEESGCHL